MTTDTPETDAQLTTFTSISKLKKHFVNRTGTVSAEFARKLERERDHWKSESLEQAKLLAMGADREEKLRDALEYIAGLDTSQAACAELCSAVAVAVEVLDK
jgi:hypothetical protein